MGVPPWSKEDSPTGGRQTGKNLPPCRLAVEPSDIRAQPAPQRQRRSGVLFVPLLALMVVLLGPLGAAWAVSERDFPQDPPATAVLDGADVFSRASRADLEKQLEGWSSERVEARLVTLSRLDYGLSLDQLAQDLLQRWSSREAEASAIGGQDAQLLVLIDTQTKAAAIAASPSLQRQLPEDLLRSTASSTMALPLREGNRYRQASIDGLNRLFTVLRGGEDPGEPETAEVAAVPTNIPTREETLNSNGFTWVVVLLVVGSVVPMLTWWVFSR